MSVDGKKVPSNLNVFIYPIGFGIPVGSEPISKMLVMINMATVTTKLNIYNGLH